MGDMYRLEMAFDNLKRQGFITEHNFWCCGGCAGGGILQKYEALSEDSRSATPGFVFYHEQNAENAIQYKELRLHYGALPADSPRHADVAIGERIAAALKSEGLSVEWSGDPGETILIPRFSVYLEEIPQGEGSDLHSRMDDEDDEDDEDDGGYWGEEDDMDEPDWDEDED